MDSPVSTPARPAAAEATRYTPIRDYGLIGDCHGAALISRDGAVDWWSRERFDAEPTLWRLLDADKGPVFQIRPVAAEARAERRYRERTNILSTVWRHGEARVEVTDFMPVGRAPGAGADDYVTLAARGWLVRIVTALGGAMRIRVRFAPAGVRFDPQAAEQGEGSLQACLLYADPDWPDGRGETDEVITLEPGERRAFVLAPVSDAAARPAHEAESLLAVTTAFWREWWGRCRHAGPYQDQIRRSALALKLMTFAPTGAIVAAPTTSLPEEIGGIRNWDYRFNWLRDTAFVLQALAALGYSGEARRYCDFLKSCCACGPTLRVLYDIRATCVSGERLLDHLDGYAGSRPVRIGNAAADQLQIDIFGELADWACVYHMLGEPLDDSLRAILRDSADHVAAHWREPDQGIWEMRGPPQHHVHGKVMAWVALDRALGMLGPNPRWQTERDAILEALLQSAIDADGGYLTQCFGNSEADAALLLVPLLGLPLPRPVLERTIDRVQDRLQHGDYVHRYRTADGLPGGEGAFLICSFWLVDALLTLDRGEQARQLFERLLDKANDLGLYAEEIDPGDAAFLGNFPQAYTHLALINSAILLQLHDNGGLEALAGTQADRTLRAVASQRRLLQEGRGGGPAGGGEASILMPPGEAARPG